MARPSRETEAVAKPKQIPVETSLHKPKNSKLYFLYFIPELSSKLLKYFESLVFLISLTCSQLLQIENAVAFEISQSEFLQAIKAFLLSILCIFP